MLLLAFSHSTPTLPFILLGFLSRALSGLSIALAMRVCTDSSGYSVGASDYPEILPAVISGLETSSGVGLMLGPIVGSLVYEKVGFAVIFYCYGGTIASIVPLYSFLKTKEILPGEAGEEGTSMWKLLGFRVRGR